MRLQFRQNKAAILPFHPPEGRADSAATLNIHTSQTTKIVDGASVSLDSFSESLTASSSAGALSISCDTTNAVIGEHYWLVNGFGQAEEILVDGKDATTLLLVDGLRYNHTTSSTVAGHKLAYSITSTINATRRRFVRASWEYVVGGVTKYAEQFYDVVRQPYWVPVLLSDLRSAWRAAPDYLPSRQELVSLLDGPLGSRDWVERDLLGSGQNPEFIRDPNELKPLVVYKLLERLAAGRLATAEEELEAVGWVKYWKEEYKIAMNRLIGNKRLWYDEDDDLNVDGYTQTIVIGGVEVSVTTATEHEGLILRETMGLKSPKLMKVC
jgi:hypothetical protein